MLIIFHIRKIMLIASRSHLYLGFYTVELIEGSLRGGPICGIVDYGTRCHIRMIFGQFNPLKSPLFRYGGISVGDINSQVKLNESEITELVSDLKNLFNSSQVSYQTQH